MDADAASEFGRAFRAALIKQNYTAVSAENTLFAKMTGSETVGIIAVLPQQERYPAVYCGIATVYCRDLNPALWTEQIPRWMNPLTFFYHAHYPDTWTRETMELLSGKPIESVKNAAFTALQTTVQLVLPMLDKVSDLSSAADFLIRFGHSVTEWEDAPETESAFAEDLLCVRAGYQGDFLEALETRREYTQHLRSDAERGIETDRREYSDYAKQTKERAMRLKQTLMLTLVDGRRLKEAQSVCEQRRSRNRLYLLKAGILPDEA